MSMCLKSMVAERQRQLAARLKELDKNREVELVDRITVMLKAIET